MAGLAAHAAWHMGQWDEMAAYTNEMRTHDTSTGSFLLAVQAVHNKNLDAAKGEGPLEDCTHNFLLLGKKRNQHLRLLYWVVLKTV